MKTDINSTNISRRDLIRSAFVGAGAAAITSLAAAPASAGQFGSFSLDPLIAPLQKQFDLPALAAGVMIGDIFMIGAVGVRRYGLSASKVTHDDQFHLGSCTKAMTGTLIGMLFEQGIKVPSTGKTFGWTTPLLDIFPEARFLSQSAYSAVTMAHLLAHRSGFSSSSMPNSKALSNQINVSLPPLSRQLYTFGILQDPPAVYTGTYLYSNRNFTVLGAVIERLTGQSWENYITTRLFQPLGMTTAGFGPMGTNFVDQPFQHLFSSQLNTHFPIAPNPWSDNPEVIGPAGTVHCSVLHWLKFVQEHNHGLSGKGKLMSSATYGSLHSPGFGGNYVAGWIQGPTSWSSQVYSHAGSNTQNFATVAFSPQQSFAIVVMTNQGGSEAANACDATTSMLVKWAQSNGII